MIIGAGGAGLFQGGFRAGITAAAEEGTGLPFLNPKALFGKGKVDVEVVDSLPERPPKTVYHQGDLADGVSPRRPLSTSPDPDLTHYHPDGDLYRFDIPSDVYDQWILDESIIPFTDYHFPSGITRPEIRIMPPASGQMNDFLIPPSGG